MRRFLILLCLIDLFMTSVAHADSAINISVGQSSDDAVEIYAIPGTVSLGGTSLPVGYDGLNIYSAGLRFDGLNIPPGANVVDAYIQFESRLSLSGAALVTIAGQLTADAPTFTATDYDISTRSQTAAQIPWDIPAWAADEQGLAERSPDIASIVEEIVALPGWATGNAMVFVLDGTAAGNYRQAYAFDGAGSPPYLYVIWCYNDCLEDILRGDEFLNIQDIFTLFLGRWILIFMGAALAGTVTRTLISVLWRRPQLVRIVRSDNDDE